MVLTRVQALFTAFGFDNVKGIFIKRELLLGTIFVFFEKFLLYFKFIVLTFKLDIGKT